MNLKKRLRIAFLIIIILPIMLAFLIGNMIIKYQLASIQETYKIETNSVQTFMNPLQILNRVTRDVFNRIKLYAMTTPYFLEDMELINALNDELKDKYSFLVIKKGDEIIYEGDPEKFAIIRSSIERYGSHDTEVDGGYYVSGKNPVLIKQQEYKCADGTMATILIITDIDTVIPQVKTFAIQAILSLIFIIIITAFFLIIWLYRGIIYPLNVLKIATKEMKEGNLDYSIHMNSDDDISQLCADFEEMRIHLKELIEVKMKYEENSRELLSNISHDLKTPLTTIKGYAEGIIDGVADTPEKLDRYVKTIYHKASDMSSLVDELSMYSKINNDAMPFNFRVIDAREYFNDCVDELAFEMEVKKLQFSYQNDVSESCKIIIDTEQMKRVIHNIINNSEKYMDKEDGKIEVRVKELSEYIQVEIEDNGAGIDQKDLPYVFDRFYRADLSRNSSKGGSGLGLAIVRKIIEEHGGSIRASSKLLEGTTIYFTVMKWSEKAMEETKFCKIKKEMILQVKD